MLDGRTVAEDGKDGRIMGCVRTITYDRFPKQKGRDYKYPQFAVGSRVSVCYYYNTSKTHLGTIVRDDCEEPYETIIKLDNGRYLRGVECQYSYIDDWNYNMDYCPLDTKVRLLSSDDCMLLPQMEFVGTLTDNGNYITRGKCYKGDPDYFYRSKIVAWKPYREEWDK